MEKDDIILKQNISALLRGITSKHDSDVYCENKNVCGAVMLSEDTKKPSIIYADLKSYL